MRSRNLRSAVTAVTAMLALAPASALANQHPNSRGCTVILNVSPREDSAGNPVRAYGRVTCPLQVNLAGQAVVLFEHSYGVHGHTMVQSTTTDARGYYQFSPVTVQSNSFFFARSHNAQSGRKRVGVEAQVTLSGPPSGSQLLTGASHKVTFTGTVNPADEGARVALQGQDALTGNEWRGMGIGTVGHEGHFTIVHAFSVAGSADLRVLVRSQNRNIPSTSNELTYEISQAQNPQLTITASQDPIVSGESVKISGTATGKASELVTLLARTVHQHGFAPAGEVTTNSSGEYTFPAQFLTNSTFYEVRAGGQKSAVLFEGVEDMLTAKVSSSTVQAGQSLTFSGTVIPDHTGHIIYLERQNASGTGFRVVQIATIGAGSSYSITHKVYDPGTKVFRVRIPGGPDNEGVASSPFTIQVTPAPASSLTQEAPGNSSFPAEGSEHGGEERESLAEGEGPRQ
jgi:hypothetical protein